MEREPEENYHTEYGKQCIHALSYLLCIHLHCSGIARFCSNLLAGIGEFLSVDDENYQRKNHSQDSYTECIMETGGKHVQIFIGKYRHIRYGCSGNSGFRCQCTISVHSLGSQRSCQMSVAKGRQVDEAARALKKVGIPSPESRLSQYPHEFSGGMRQRVLIAMALCCKPALLIADEPTTALDVTIQAQILELVKQLRDEEGMSIVLITHDLGIVASLSNRISVMYGGLIMEEGLTDEIFYHPKHPYTRALLHAIPQPATGVKERLEAIPGMAPSLMDLPKGCPFAQRCKYACADCEKQLPKYRQYTDTQRAMCIFTGEELDEKDWGAGRESWQAASESSRKEGIRDGR